ncbi:hypothetical protein [Saccharothrix coeruleofusca]|uniref:Uncharacterized protein n=1 Tax=Saccharothrix coeruleofusca TaxID=33919 RepID=A0A918AKR7_9PSEU|nr:hypothetical protein [Saccharothrix coeruleofusca]MBP2338260.1 hypothetical protein [Saccharothrix coeruleofusca]GGP49627.1 hypothetical protein GCM10010185_22250 [Saccharothrix coeruleofusca]
MEWTVEALKAEVDYRQAALLADAAHTRAERRAGTSKRAWWRWSTHRREGR